MITIHSDQNPEWDKNLHSLFMVGPTPRDLNTKSWRPQALQILEEANYNGVVCVPERGNWGALHTYQNQVEWEYYCLSNCTKIVAWIPRNMETMLALTTNIEMGYWLAKDPDRVLYGRPDESPHNRYIDWLYHKITNRNHFNDLKSLLLEAIK